MLPIQSTERVLQWASKSIVAPRYAYYSCHKPVPVQKASCNRRMQHELYHRVEQANISTLGARRHMDEGLFRNGFGTRAWCDE